MDVSSPNGVARHRIDARSAGRVQRARARLRDRAWKIAVLGLLVGPFAALTQAGPDAAGVTDLHRTVASMIAVVLLVAAGEGSSLAYYAIDRRQMRA